MGGRTINAWGLEVGLAALLDSLQTQTRPESTAFLGSRAFEGLPSGCLPLLGPQGWETPSLDLVLPSR